MREEDKRYMTMRTYQKELERYVQKMVADVLAHEGIVLNEDVCTIHSATEYLLIMGSNYSVYQWIEDTKKNYPESFK